MKGNRRLIETLIACCAWLAAAWTFGAAYTWDAGPDPANSDRMWGTDVNWDPDGVPGSSDTVTFSNTTAGIIGLVDLGDTARTVVTATFSHASGSYTLTNGTLRLTSTATNALRITGNGSVTLNVVVGAPGDAFGLRKDGNGRLALGASNNFSGGIYLANGGITSSAAGALGHGVFMFVGSGNALTLSTVDHSITNPIVFAVANPGTISSPQNVALSGSITLPNSTTSSKFDADGIMTILGPVATTPTTGGNSLLEMNGDRLLIYRPSSVTESSGVNARHVISKGALAITNANDLFTGNLNLSGGVLILDRVTWEQFAANRSGGFSTGATAGNRTWQISSGGGGFAARGVPLNIGSPGEDLSTAFDRNFTLGTAVLGPDGGFYADQPVNIRGDITLSADRTITSSPTGPGLAGPFAGRVCHRISGKLSGPYVPLFTGGGTATELAEIVLAGSNTWTGTAGAIFNGPQAFNVGRGGYLNAVNGGTGQGGVDAYIRFDGQSSLPTGNQGSPAHLAALMSLSGGSQARRGFLLTSSPEGRTYHLPQGCRFVIGGIGNRGQNGVLGATSDSGTPGLAILRNSDVVCHWGHVFTGGPSSIDGLQEDRPYVLLVRDGAFVLGTTGDGPEGPVTFIPAKSEDTAVSTNATVLLDDERASHYLAKRGEGTLAMSNVAYRLVNGTGDTSSKFVWNIGRGNSAQKQNNPPDAPFFDGAVRGRSTYADDNTATLSNSLFASSGSFALNLRGGVYEVDANGATQRTFAASLGTGSGAVNWSYGGGGFSAYGGTLLVNLGGTNQEWQQSNFVPTNNPLIFGSWTATHDVRWADPVGLANADNATVEREIRVIAQAVEFLAGLRNRGSGAAGGTGTRSLIKTGGGTLRFVSGATYDYNGATSVRGGLLEVNQNWNAPGGAITVTDTGRLGGTGSVGRDVMVQNGGGLAPGPRGGAGTLTLSNLTVAAGSVYEWDFLSDASDQFDKAVLTGQLSLTGPWTVRLSQLGSETPSRNRYVLFETSGSIVGFDPDQVTVDPGGTEWPIVYTVRQAGQQIVLETPSARGTLMTIR